MNYKWQTFVRRALLMGVAWSGLASAADLAGDGVARGSSSTDAALGEIVVTAQRRSEKLQDVPIAVSAFSQADLDKQQIFGGPELALVTPNVTFAKSYFGGFNFQIRGIGTQLGTTTADAGVSVTLNEMPLVSSRFFEAEFFDQGQVEVLRGPQGTLYGRNATGGVVNVNTAQPSDNLEGEISLEGGNYSTRKLKGFVNLPLIGNNLELRLAGSVLKSDGFGVNTETGADVNGRDLYSTRATLAFKPTDWFESSLMWQHFSENDNRTRTQASLCDRAAPITSLVGVPVTNAIVQGLISQGCADGSLYGPQAHGTPNSLSTLFGIISQEFGLTTGDYNAGKTLSSNLNDTDSLFQPKYRASDDILQLPVRIDLSDTFRLTTLTGYSTDRVDGTNDFEGSVPTGSFNVTPLTPGGVFADPVLGTQSQVSTLESDVQRSHQFSQEVRLASSLPGPTNFSVGANYLEYKTVENTIIAANAFTAAAEGINSGAPCALGNPNCIYIDPSSTPGGIGHNYFFNSTPYQLTSEAIFGEIYRNLTDNLKLTIGARYTHDHKVQTNLPVPTLTPGSGLALGSPAYLTATFNEPTWRAGLDWKVNTGFTDQTMLYFTYSRGYKAGGPNAPASVGFGSVQPNFAPEFVNAFEIGAKNTLLDGRMTADLTAFYYNYSNYQISVLANRVLAVENVNAKIKGLEFETAWRPVESVQLNATAGALGTSIVGGSSVDSLNQNAGDPSQTVLKTAAGENCTVPTSALGNLVDIIEQLPNAPKIPGVSGNPLALLGACSGAFSALGVIPSAGTPTSTDGRQLPNSPHFTLSVGAQYSWNLPARWLATVRADYFVQSSSYARIYNDPADYLKGWDQTNLGLTFLNDQSRWQFDIFTTNVFDKQPIVNSYLTDAATGLVQSSFTIAPRLIGGRVTKRF
jgi:outer membrane receptor protein involved in Fe transport